MRSLVAAVTLVPALVLAQQAPPEWEKANDAWIAKYSADFTKRSGRVDKQLDDLDKREDAWRSLGRDFFGMTSNNAMDPTLLDRIRAWRRSFKAFDDSSANNLIERRKGATPPVVLGALRTRITTLSRMIPEHDSAVANARFILRTTVTAYEKAKSDENPSMPPQQKQVLKRIIEWYDKYNRYQRMRADYHASQGKACEDEISTLNKEIAAIALSASP